MNAPVSFTRRQIALVIGIAVVIAGLVPFLVDWESNSAARPAPRDEPSWGELHDEYVARAKVGGIDLLFLGDSITLFWDRHPEVWDRFTSLAAPPISGSGAIRPRISSGGWTTARLTGFIREWSSS